MLAIPLWATWPALATFATAVPPFELLAIAYLVGCGVLWKLESPRDRDRRGDGRPFRALIAPLFCAFGVCGSSAFFIFATHRIPPAQAHLIAYLWPAMLVIVGGALRLFRLRWRHVGGVALGFSGAAVLVRDTPLSGSGAGIALALLSGLSWALYCLFRLRQGPAAGNVLTAACVISAAVCTVLHIATEHTVVPGAGALAAAVCVGIFPLALANFAWDRGVRQGNSQLLAVMAYATPILSALLLVMLGMAVPTMSLAVGGVLIAAAGLISRNA